MGIAPEAAIARGPQGAMVAYIARNARGQRALFVLALDVHGAPARSGPRELEGADNPSAPSVARSSAGYVLAFRDHTGARTGDNRERVVLALLGDDGAIAPWPNAQERIGGASPLANAAAIPMAGSARALGAPVVVGNDSQIALVFASQNENEPRFSVTSGALLPTRALRSIVLDQGELAMDAAPGATFVGPALRWAIEGRHDNEAAIAAHDGSALAWSSHGVLSPSILAADASRALLAYVSAPGAVSSNTTTVRVRALDGEALAPSSLGVYASSAKIDAALVALGPNLFGAVTFSQSAADASGSLNVALTNSDGAFVGRHHRLAQLPLRSARVAASSASDGSAWVLIDGRADNGSAALGLVAFRCDANRAADAAALPTGTMVLNPPAPDDAPVHAEQPTGVAMCAPQGQPAVVATVSAQSEDVTADNASRSVVLRDGRVQLFVQRAANGEHSAISAHTINADATVVASNAIEDGAPLLDAALVGNDALAIDARGAIYRGNGRTLARNAARLPGTLRAARFVRGGAGVVAYEEIEQGATRLTYFPVSGARLGAGVALSLPEQRAGSTITVLDAVLAGASAHALVGVEQGGRAMVRALHSFDPRRLGAANRQLPQLFADPISVGGEGGALLVHGAELSLVWTDREVVRRGLIRNGALRDVRSLFGYMRGGGRTPFASRLDASTLTITASPGVSPQENPALRYAITTYTAQAGLRSLSLEAPSDANAITSLGQGYALPDANLAVIYARSTQQGSLEWLVQRARCAAPAGGAR